MKFILSTFVALSFIITLAFDSPVFGQPVVVPNQFENQAGNRMLAGFDCTRPSGLRTHIIYLGSEVGKGEIISFAFRGLPDTPAFGPQLFPNMTVKMSTTDKQPGDLDTVFAANIGPDETTVFQGSFTSNVPDCTGLSPCPFAQPIQFQNPFPFDPVKPPKTGPPFKL